MFSETALIIFSDEFLLDYGLRLVDLTWLVDWTCLDRLVRWK